MINGEAVGSLAVKTVAPQMRPSLFLETGLYAEARYNSRCEQLDLVGRYTSEKKMTL